MALPPFGLAVAKWALLVIGAADVALVTLLAVGGAASLALWTGVTARLIVRREGAVALGRSTPMLMGAALGVLAVMAATGLVLAGPVAGLVADPAAAVSFGSSGGLAHGWSVALERAGFAVPFVALLAVVASLAAVVVARRIPLVAPQPYLAGANVGPGGSVAFHGPRADPVEATSGGFYWGAARTTTRGWADSLSVAGAFAVALVVAASFVAMLVRVATP
jgi:hypothetical protein